MWTSRILFLLLFWSYHNLLELEGQVGFYYTDETMTREELEDFWENASEKEKKKIQDIVLYRIEEKYSSVNMEFVNFDIKPCIFL